MNRSWETICASIQTSLAGRDVDFPAEVNWTEVFQECRRQGITGIVYVGVASRLPAQIKNVWMQYNLQNVLNGNQVVFEEGELCKLLMDIPFCILKGTAASVYYPQPLLRTMGDIDFIVHPAYFEEAKHRLVRAGYKPSEEDNTRHICLEKDEVIFEMHYHFSHDELDVDEYIDRCYGKFEDGTISDVSFPMLPDLENGIVILAHLRQHLYSGLGMRQILDWMMYAEKLLDDSFWNESFQKEARALGLEKLAMSAAHLCQMYFGLNPGLQWCVGADENVCRRLMENIIESGNFGQNLGSGKAVEKTIINIRKEGYFRYLQKAGEYNWKTYQKHHWLKPFAWVYQIGRYIKQGFQTGRDRQSIKEDISRSNERFELLKDLGL